MNWRLHRIWTRSLMVLTGATVFQVLGGFGTTNGAISGGCNQFYSNGIATSIDFCYLLDCRNGFFGGLVDPCGNPNTTADDLLVDCANITPNTGGGGTGTGTDTGTGTNTGTGTQQSANTGTSGSTGGFGG